MDEKDAPYLVYITCPDRALAGEIARSLVEKGLAAGANIVPCVESIYRWRGETRRRSECALFVQASGKALGRLREEAAALHTDLVPCILETPVSGGQPEFLRWIEENSG